jgi:MFS family permease
MIQQFYYRLLAHRHFWRYASFSEVSELYASRTLRMLAVNMSAVFMSVFLYQNNYSIVFISGYWAVYYFIKLFMAFPSAHYAARFGAKHGIMLSNLLYIPSMIAFSFVPEWGIVAIIFTGLLQGLSATMYSICYTIDFSKVKSISHAGKEIAYMNIVEKIATGLSPVIGGLLAYYAGPEVTMYVAAGLFAVAAVPLMQTPEPMKTHHPLLRRGFPWHLTYRSMIADVGTGFDMVASGTVWSLLIAVAIIGVRQNNKVYAILGLLASVVVLAALAASYTYGKIIDRRKGGELLKAAVIVDALVHLTRPFVHSLGAAGTINVANEVATTGYAMAFTRGMFDTADMSGYRMTYLAYMQIVMDIGALFASIVLMIFAQTFGEIQGMRLFFFVAAAVVLVIGTPKFHLYQK